MKTQAPKVTVGDQPRTPRRGRLVSVAETHDVGEIHGSLTRRAVREATELASPDGWRDWIDDAVTAVMAALVGAPVDREPDDQPDLFDLGVLRWSDTGSEP